MVAHCLLVITGDVERFTSLHQLLTAASGATELRVELNQSVTGAKLYAAEDGVDAVLLDLEPGSWTDPPRLSLVVDAFAPTPVVAWHTDGDDERCAQWTSQGAAACFDDAMDASEFMLQTLRLIVHHARAQQLLQQQQKETGITLEAIADAVICTNARAEITFLNSAARRLLNCPLEDVLNRPITELMALHDAESHAPILHAVHQVIATLQSSRVMPGTILVRQDGSEIRIQDVSSPIIGDTGALTGVVMVFHDTTEAYEMQAQVDYLAWHDFLTKLPNRFAIEKHLDQALSHAGTHHQRVPVLYLDLDKFKLVNDTLGHGAGDKLLVSVAERLRGCFRMIDLVGRQGGDEFVVVMAPGSNVEDAMLAAARITESLTGVHEVGGTEVRVGCSVGIAMFPEHGSTVDLLLQHADTALQSVKTGGRNGWRVFSYALQSETQERQQLEDRMRIALLTGGFSLFYQPKVSLLDGKVCGCEALLRWNEPEWGWVPPTKFIPCAEASGLICLLGRWVFDEALRQAKTWDLRGLSFGSIAINLSAEELRHPELIDYIRAQLQASGVDPALLQIELTESMLMHDTAQAIRRLKELKELGICVAIDDFGTGYSSLSYLADFPIDVLKIDRSFIHGINRAGTRQQALLHAILTLAKTLSLVVVAEGIETAEENQFLLHTGCEVGQGYYYSTPLEVGDFERFVLADAGRA